MKKHTRIWMDSMGYEIGDVMPCELPICEAHVVDTHHIEPRGMGGDPTGKRDVPENLIGLCRPHHLDAEARVISKEELKQIRKEALA